MNQKNLDYLKDQVKFTGFGEGLENELKEKMQKTNAGISDNPQKLSLAMMIWWLLYILKNLIRLICISSIVTRST